MTREYVPDAEAITQVVNGLELACLTWGAEDAPLVVLVHGFPDTARTWDTVGPALAEAGFRVLAPYTRGIAPSTIPADGDYGSDTLGRDVLALIEAAGRERAVVVGHDFGASAAYSAAGLGPERVERLVTVAIPHPATLALSPRKAWGARHFIAHRLPGAARRFAKNDFAQIRVLYERWSPGFDWPEAELEAAKNSYTAPGCCQAALDYYAHITPKVPPGQRVKLGMPSLIIGGETDGILGPSDFERSRSRFTGHVEVAMLPGGHFLHREHPRPFIDRLLRFLRADPPAPAR